MGLPITTANGTNRIAVVLQNLTASLTFIRKRMLDVKAGLLLSIPTVVGNIVGSMLARGSTSGSSRSAWAWC